MPSTQSSVSIDSTAKVTDNDVGHVNHDQQPTPALAMSIDRNEPGQRAMRLRGGCCCVRYSTSPESCSNLKYLLCLISSANRNSLLLWLHFKDLLLRKSVRAFDATCNDEAKRYVSRPVSYFSINKKCS